MFPPGERETVNKKDGAAPPSLFRCYSLECRLENALSIAGAAPGSLSPYAILAEVRPLPAVMLGVFALTLFFSASLLFLIEPMVGKMMLPLLGGTPAVGNACMVLFLACAG